MTLIGLTLGGLLGKKDGVDEGDDSTLGDGDASQKPVELLIITDGKLKVTRDDPGLLVVPGSVSGELEDLGSEVLHDHYGLQSQIGWLNSKNFFFPFFLLKINVNILG